MTFSEIEQENAKLRSSLVEANRFSTELAMKLATAGHIIGFPIDSSATEIAAQCTIRTRWIFTAPQSPSDQ